jgi:hypothetical protein
VEGPDTFSRRRKALASNGGCCVLLPDVICAQLVTLVDIYVRPRDLARLPLLFWSRDVGH